MSQKMYAPRLRRSHGYHLAACVCAYLTFVSGCGPGTKPLDEIETTCQWQVEHNRHRTRRGAPTSQPQHPRTQPGQARAELYIDLSKPMGGYLPNPGKSHFHLGDVASSAFRNLRVQLRAEPTILGFGKTIVENLEIDLDRLKPSDFKESTTELVGVLEHIRDKVQGGEVRAAAVVTDLVGTGKQGVSGADVLIPLLRSMWSDESIHVCLVGIRVRYSGYQRRRTKPLGVRWSESAHQVYPLTAPVDRPLYMLVVGDAQAASICAATERSAKESKEAPETFRAPLLEPAAKGQMGVTCAVDGRFALRKTASGEWKCQQDKKVELRCKLDPDAALLAHLQPAARDEQPADPWSKLVGQLSPSWEAVTVNYTPEPPEHLRLEVDCEALRTQKPSAALFLSTKLKADQVDAPPWLSWSTRNDSTDESANKTLGLAALFQGGRLESNGLELRCGPFGQMAQRKKAARTSAPP